LSGLPHAAAPGRRNADGCAGLLVLMAKCRDLDMDSVARLHAASSQLSRNILAASAAIAGAVVLSTCNRFEIFCDVMPGTDPGAARPGILESLTRSSGVPRSSLSSWFEYKSGQSAAEHLMAVACGLESAVVGEREITGQVRRALSEAQKAGTASGQLTRLFQAAARTAKEVGARTSLSAAGRSIASVALEMATTGHGRPAISDAAVVVLGTGSYAGCITRLLKDKQCSNISVFSRSGRAEAFVAVRGGTALTPMELPAAVRQADILVGCSGSGTRIGVSGLMRWRQETRRPLAVVDLAPSHDFEPHVADLEGIELITLESVHANAPGADADALHQARTLVRQAARRFEEQQRLRSADLGIVALRQHLHQVLDAEMDRVRNQRERAAAAEEVNIALRRIVRQLLHTPTVRARELAAEGRQDDYLAALDALFGIRAP
jgi:glutamyl-tRNA reductase